MPAPRFAVLRRPPRPHGRRPRGRRAGVDTARAAPAPSRSARPIRSGCSEACTAWCSPAPRPRSRRTSRQPAATATSTRPGRRTAASSPPRRSRCSMRSGGRRRRTRSAARRRSPAVSPWSRSARGSRCACSRSARAPRSTCGSTATGTSTRTAAGVTRVARCASSTSGRPGVRRSDAAATIATRRGCDRDPIDATADGAALTLLSYVWPGQDARFDTLRAALDIAAAFPVTVDRADAVEWVPAQLAEPHAGLATVVMHSVFWQYLSTDDAGVDRRVARGGRRPRDRRCAGRVVATRAVGLGKLARAAPHRLARSRRGGPAPRRDSTPGR